MLFFNKIKKRLPRTCSAENLKSTSSSCSLLKIKSTLDHIITPPINDERTSVEVESSSSSSSLEMAPESKIVMPLPSLEAFTILRDTNASILIRQLVFHFMQLFDLQNSKLVELSYAQGDLDNGQFIQQLLDTSNRLIAAIKSNTPYPTLFGDVCVLQNQLQVISLYYQEELSLHSRRRIANKTLQKMRLENSEFSDILSKTNSEDCHILTNSESGLFTKYVINSCAYSIMKEDVTKIAEFILEPVLMDHRSERGFSYLSPRI